MIGSSAQETASVSTMTPHEIAVANLRHRPLGLIVIPVADGTWAIFDPWWRYISRDDVGIPASQSPGGSPMTYGFWPGELSGVLNTLRNEYEWKAPGGAKAPPTSVAMPSSPDDLGL